MARRPKRATRVTRVQRKGKRKPSLKRVAPTKPPAPNTVIGVGDYRFETLSSSRRLDRSLTATASLAGNRQSRLRRNNEARPGLPGLRSAGLPAAASLGSAQSRSPERPKNTRKAAPQPNKLFMRNCVPKPNSQVAGRISAERAKNWNADRAKTREERLRSFRLWCK